MILTETNTGHTVFGKKARISSVDHDTELTAEHRKTAVCRLNGARISANRVVSSKSDIGSPGSASLHAAPFFRLS